MVSCSKADMRRIGLLGGTFDPPHLGHAILADQVGYALDLDEVRLVVANEPWQKTEASDRPDVTSAPRRLEMTKMLLADLSAPAGEHAPAGEQGDSVKGDGPKLVASDVEMTLGGPSYTSVTLEHLKASEPDVEWTVVVGSDAAAGLHTWHRADDLRLAAHFAVVARGGTPDLAASPGFHITEVTMPTIEISSTDIRRRTATGASVRFLTTPGVIDLMVRWGLYRPRV